MPHRLLCFLLFIVSSGLWAADPFLPVPPAEADIPVLKPKFTAGTKARRATPLVGSSRLAWPFWDLVLWGQTPLVHESTYEKRFNNFGAGLGIVFGNWQLGAGLLRAETGARFSRAGLTLTQPDTSFSHLYIDFPLLMIWLLPFGEARSMAMEFFAGLHLRVFEYDSRPTTDGGFGRNTSTAWLQPEGGIGAIWRVGSTVQLRVRAGYLFLALGLGLSL